MARVLLIGSGGREDALAKALLRSAKIPELYVYGTHENPSLLSQAKGYTTGKLEDNDAIVAFAKLNQINFCVIGPEAPLAAGIVDALAKCGIPSIGPNHDGAQLESSKSFTRMLLDKYQLPHNPRFAIFDSLDGLEDYMHKLGEFVIKPDGLTGGKGVLVKGDHFTTIEEALQHCDAIISDYGIVVIEEKLVGEEFSVISLTDGTTSLHFPPVQDHKRAFSGDTGPNTGGMGSYTDYNHLLPFLTRQDVEAGQKLNELVIQSIQTETGKPYRGIIYGGYMAVKGGIRLIEFNARFGDPEALNLLTLLSSDFMQLCELTIRGELHKGSLLFQHQASVCKYLVPEGYPNKKSAGTVTLPPRPEHIFVYPASVTQTSTGFKLEGSRAIGIVGLGNTLDEAHERTESYIALAKGKFRYRKDIGTKELIQKRIDHMKLIRG